jgi:uncharacterized hydrophobic protein (TIGR00271 family)
MAAEQDDFLGEIRLGRQLSTVWQVAAGGLIIGFALAFLIPSRVADLVGAISPIATLLMLLTAVFTILNILELRAGSSDHGGTYTLIHETLGGIGGFLAGWVTFAGSMALSAIFIRSAAAQLELFLQMPAEIITALALSLLILMVVFQIFRIIPRRTLLGPSLTILTLIIGVMLVDIFLKYDLHINRGALDFVSGNFMRAAAWLFVTYGAIEAVMASRRQIRDAQQRLPGSLFATIMISGVALIAFEFLPIMLPENLIKPVFGNIPSALQQISLIPGRLIHAITFLLFVVAANASLVMGARQLNALSRQGALPPVLRWLKRPFRVQPIIFGLILVIIVPLLIWTPTDWLLDMAAGFFLVSAFLLNLAALISRRAEPNRRRTLQVAFYPLVPLSALALCAAMWIALPGYGLLGNTVWITLGSLLYVSYSRMHLIEAQEGVLVFRRAPGREKKEDDYRILVPLSAGLERHWILDLAMALAHQTDGEVIPLQVIPIADPLAIAEGGRIASERNTLFQWSTRIAAKSDVPIYPITRLARSIPDGILETADEEDCDLVLLSWVVRSEQQGVHMGRVLDPVIRRAPCDVAVVALHSEYMSAMATEARESQTERSEIQAPVDEPGKLQIDNILVPTAGGPHAPLATRLAMLLAHEFDASMSVVYVADPDATEEQLAQGHTWIDKTIKTMREQVSSLPTAEDQHFDFDQLPFTRQVVRAESVVDGIAQAGAESDLVFIGASEESLLDQVLFGTIPELVARVCSTPVLMVKRFRGLRRFWLQRAWDTLFGAVPTLNRQEQVDIYSEVREGARPDVDFFIMIGLSAVIATFGLLQDSTAVIIGAMLVAPLFTPILAFSLAIVQGDVRLLSLAVESAIKGIALAIGLSILLTAISPLREITNEILSRTNPNLFDLAVALASGAAGAYAVARKDVATSLPGVAIAAALVPPLGVVGIGLAMGEARIAGGGVLLFITNLIAITLAGTVTLLLLGFRPSPRAKRKGHLQRGMIASLVLLIAISIPLASVFIDSVEISHIRQVVGASVRQKLEVEAGYTLETLEIELADSRAVDVSITIHASKEMNEPLLEELQSQLEDALDRPIHLQVVSVPIESYELRSD